MSAGPAGAQRWRRNLAVLWIAEFIVLVGFNLATPFLPIFINRDLGVADPADLARWTGLVAGVPGISMAVASPVWGVLADRYGRKPMLVRAMLGGAITVGLISLVQTPEQLIGLRLAMGATSGTVGAATALVAAETPRGRVGWALGLLSSSVALGSALGPLVGGLGAFLFGYRAVFVAAAVCCLGGLLPVVFLVHESEREAAPRPPAASGGSPLRGAPAGTLLALSVLVGAQALMAVSQVTIQQLAVLKLLGVDRAGAGLLAGIGFAGGGVLTALASVAAGWIAARRGYRWPAAVAALGMGAVELLMAASPSVFTVTAALILFGLAFGILSPCLSSMLGLEAPLAIQSTVFGIAASSLSLGFAVGPIAGGVIAASRGIDAALVATAASALVLALLLGALAREPRPAMSAPMAAAELAPSDA